MTKLDSLLSSLKKEVITKTRLPNVINEIRKLDSYSKLMLLAKNSEKARAKIISTVNVWLKTSYDTYLNEEYEDNPLDAPVAIALVVVIDSSETPDYIVLSRDIMNDPSLQWSKMIAQSNILSMACG